MKRVLLVFLCLCLIGQVITTANATVLIVSASRQKIILAVDSRATIDGNRHDDTQCKIVPLNSRLVFAAAGLVADMAPSLPKDARFDVTAIARKSASEYRYDPESMVSPYDSVKEIAKIWGRQMFFQFQTGAPVRLPDWLRLTGVKEAQPFVTGIFIGLEGNGEVNLAFQSLDYAGEAREGEIRPTARPGTTYFELSDQFTRIETFGIDQIAKEHLKSSRIRTEQRKNPELFDEKIPTELIELSINDTRWNQYPGPKGIGGPIHAVEIKADRGVRGFSASLTACLANVSGELLQPIPMSDYFYACRPSLAAVKSG